MVDYTLVSQDEWERLAPVQQPDPWEPLMADLSQGKIVSLPYTDAKDRRIKRLAIARRATTWGFRTEARYTESHLAVRRSDAPAAPPSASRPQPRRPRRRKESAED
jgi:hypothetical protein